MTKSSSPRLRRKNQAGKTPPSPELSGSLEARVAILERSMSLQVHVQDTNASVFVACMERLEFNDFILQRAFDSVNNEQARRALPSGGADWQAYQREYFGAMFLAWLASLIPPKPQVIMSVTSDEVVMFGGDQ